MQPQHHTLVELEIKAVVMVARRGQWYDRKGLRSTFWGPGRVLFFDLGAGYLGIFRLCKCSKLCTHNIALFYMYIILQYSELKLHQWLVPFWSHRAL